MKNPQKEYPFNVIQPAGGKFLGFDHVHLWVGNAMQAASFYTSRFGFEFVAYRGLETGSRNVATHVVRNTNSKIFFAFSSAYTGEEKEMGDHLVKHGDGVKDVAFLVEDATAIFNKAVKNGAEPYSQVQEYKDENGSVIMGSVKTYGDTIHTFLQRVDYKGPFLPGYRAHHQFDPVNKFIQPNNFNFVDHLVGNQPEKIMEPTVQWYENCLDFHRFWSVDENIIHTNYSSLRSVVVADFDEIVKMPINEPAQGKRKSQIQEYCDYYSGSGVQHIALNTSEIIPTIENMRSRGMRFLDVPSTYYDNLRKNLTKVSWTLKEDIDVLEKNRILVDYDENGYLLQIFTKPVEDRPTLFFEIIQRANNSGFGAGNFKALFEAIEAEQALRGNM